MKKLYTLALAAAVALSASAETQALLKSSLQATPASTELNAKVRSFTQAPVSRTDDYSSYTWVEKGEGKYAASAVAECYGASSEAASVTVYEATEKSGLYKLAGVWADIVSGGELIVDASDPDFVVIPMQATPIMDSVDGVTWIASYSAVLLEKYSKETIASGLPDVVLSLVDGVINIPLDAMCLRWPEAPADSQYGTDATSWYIYNETTVGTIVLPGASYVEPWTSLGNASVLENMLYYGFTNETNTTVTQNEIAVKTGTPGIYRLNDPLRALYDKLGASVESPSMTIDATNPDNVIIEMTPSGINGGETVGLFYYFTTSWYNENIASTTTDPSLLATLTREGDNVTITFPVGSIKLYTSNSNMLYPGADAVSTIKFVEPGSNEGAGVEDVTVSEAEGAVEYYNLQGVRLERPAAGVVIRVQGGKATKMLVK